MEYNNLKSIGKIYDFDGETGIVITPDKEYMFNINNINKPEAIHDESIVAFYPSTVKFGNEIFNVAREIESLHRQQKVTIELLQDADDIVMTEAPSFMMDM